MGERIEHTYNGGQRSSTTTPEGVINYDYLCGGRLSQVSEGGKSLQYQWDGNLLTEARYQGELNASIQYGYNNDFEVDQLSYAGASTSLSYDADGLRTGIHGFTLERSSEHGLVTELSDTALTQSRTYNGHGETAGVENQVAQNALYDYTLERNKLGQITSRTETLADGTVNEYQYSYDDRRRLTAVQKNGQLVEQYEYDANGNRTEATSTARGVSGETASYNKDDQLVSRNGTDYEYDANGRLARKTTASGEVTEYDYTSQGRLAKVVTPQHTVEYRHNALGNRVAKLVDGEVVEKYLWQDKTTLLATYDRNGNLKQRFEYTDGNTPTKFTQNGETYYILTDQLGSPRVIADASGNAVREIEYDAYGNVTADSNPDLEIPFGFAGGLKDEHTGLIRFGYRDYDPQTGRWTAKDPIGFAGGDPNLYGYVLGDPVNFLDPSGLIWTPGDPLPQGLVDFSAAFGDTISFDATDWVREQLETNGVVDKCSDAYSAGEWSGIAYGVVTGGGGLARAAGWTVRFDRYRNAGGGGINLMKNGTRKAAGDWHKFKLNGRMVNRPHYHRVPTKNQMKKHRPWQGGW